MIAGQPSYTSNSAVAPAFEILDGVRVHRVALGSVVGRERLLTRLSGYVRFLLGAWRLARRLVESERPDAVLTFHNPPFVGLIGARLAKKYSIPFAYALYDIYPDILLATRWIRLPKPAVRAWEAINRWIFRQAASVIVLGEGMRGTVISKGVPAQRVHVIPSWARPELQPDSRHSTIRRELSIPENELLILYAGNMGIMHPVELVIDATAMLRDEPMHFLFIGDGAKRERLIRRADSDQLSRVTFMPFQPEDRFARIVCASDACLVVLQPGLEKLAVPSRAYTFLSAGKPLLCIMAPEADIARLLQERECGWNVGTGTELATLLRRLCGDRRALLESGKRARAIFEDGFARDLIVSKYLRILSHMTDGRLA